MTEVAKDDQRLIQDHIMFQERKLCEVVISGMHTWAGAECCGTGLNICPGNQVGDFPLEGGEDRFWLSDKDLKNECVVKGDSVLDVQMLVVDPG